jgi:hypothetical protein
MGKTSGQDVVVAVTIRPELCGSVQECSTLEA